MESPEQPQGPQSPAPGPQSPAPPPQQYGGPVPPGGWQQAPPPVVSGQLASWGSRLGAYLIDAVIVIVPTLVVLGILGVGVLGAVGIGASADESFGVLAFILGVIVTVVAVVAIQLLYAPLLMMRQGAHNGQTWGKQMLGIRVVRDNGQPFTFWPAAVREAGMKTLAVGIATAFIPFLPWFLNFFWPLWDDQNRALHDMAVSTHVVRA